VSGVEFSAAQLVVLAAAFGPLLTAIGVLFRALIGSKNDQITVGAEALEAALMTNKELAQAVKEATTELRELRADLWRERKVGGGREGSP
jgi:hypothetical protein